MPAFSLSGKIGDALSENASALSLLSFLTGEVSGGTASFGFSLDFEGVVFLFRLLFLFCLEATMSETKPSSEFGRVPSSACCCCSHFAVDSARSCLILAISRSLALFSLANRFWKIMSSLSFFARAFWAVPFFERAFSPQLASGSFHARPSNRFFFLFGVFRRPW